MKLDSQPGVLLPQGVVLQLSGYTRKDCGVGQQIQYYHKELIIMDKWLKFPASAKCSTHANLTKPT